MKKLFYFIVGILAIASFGIHSGSAHAQTAPAAGNPSAATLQQELDVAKATLVNLEMRAGMVPAGDDTLPGATTAATPSVGTSAAAPAASNGLSAADRATISNALSSLVSALSSLNATLAANPNSVATHKAEIASVLSGMQSTLVAMNGKLSGGASAPIASANPGKTPSANGGSGSNNPGTSVSVTPSTGSLSPSAAPTAGTGNQNGNQTAQASGAWSFVVAHWPTITIIILVALILLILFWPGKDESTDHGHAAHPAPKQPNRPVNAPMQSSQASSPQPATPLATVTSAPAQRVEVQQSKVTVIRPQQPQQNPQKRPA